MMLRNNDAAQRAEAALLLLGCHPESNPCVVERRGFKPIFPITFDFVLYAR